MKIYLAVAFVAINFIFTSCGKKEQTTTPKPDVTNFTIENISSFTTGGTSKVSVSAPKLKDGVYRLHYTSKGPAMVVGDPSVTFASGKANFETGQLDRGGIYELSITDLWSASNEQVSINATKLFCDSSGFVTANINGTPFTATSLKATASTYDSVLNITGTKPYLVLNKPLYFVIALQPYMFSTGSYQLSNNPAMGCSIRYHTGSAEQISSYGTLTVTSVTPVFAGTFSFTTADSGKVTNGQFQTILQ